MHFDLTDEQGEIRDTARALLEQRSSPARVREAAESARHDDALWRELCELGWAGISIPPEDGGQGLGLVELCIVAEELGASLAPTPFLASVCAAQMILRGGTDAQRERWLPALASGEARGAIGWADGNGDSEPLVVDAPGSDVIVIAGDDGARVLETAASTLTPMATFDPLRPYATVSGGEEELSGDVERGNQETAIVIAAELLGVARRALEVTIEYVKERRQFGVPIGSFQAVSHRCADMLFATESARSAVYYAAWTADAAPELRAEASALAKFIASDAAIEVTSSAIQAHGGIGFTWEADIHWWYKRAQLAAQLHGGAGSHRERLGQLIAEQALARSA
jgi:alkylation response protein AidB-like acyl-CoA dehydrogenase